MIVLIVGGCIAVLTLSLLLFSNELNEAKYSKINVAAMVVDNEIDELKSKAQIAAFAMAGNPELIDSMISNDRDSIMSITSALKIMAQVDYCTILTNEGIVIVRTHEPDIFNDSLAHLPHVIQAMNGNSAAYVAPGVTIPLGVYAGAPVYNSDMDMIGVISLGFRLDAQDFVYKLKEITGCEITIFLYDERISTTIIDDGLYAIGTKAPENISEQVLSGEPFTGVTQISGHNILTRYTPIYGANNEVIGMLAVGYFTAEDDSRTLFFIIVGILITAAVLVVCIILSMVISKVVERRLKSMNEQNEIQLTKMNLMVKATKIALWDMEVIKDDPVNPNNAFMWSDDFRHMLGYKDKTDFPDILSSWSDLLHPDDKERTLAAFAAHLLDTTQKTPYDVEYQLLKKNGEYSYYRASGETIRDSKGNAVRVAGALIDITDAKNHLIEIEQAQELMRQARDTAEDANKAKSIFLANMSHEIRTPMNSIIGFSELAQDDNISNRTRQYLNNIADNAKWLLNIINDILDSTKIESGKIVLEHIPFDLPDVVSHCQSTISPKIAEKGIVLYCYTEPLEGKRLLGDPVRLRQVFINLLSNAVKFTTHGTVKFMTSLIESDESQVTMHFEVKDSGIGMTQEQIINIFEPFMQADDSVTRKFGGTGLGLPITKNIVELMGGSLTVESMPGVGSKFSFDLVFDVVDIDDEMISQEIILNSFEKPSFTGTVLVCEDNGLNQQVICEHLERVGLETVVAHNGKEGVDIVSKRMQRNEKPFDLIFMDIHMPVMDGLEAAKRITVLGVETPVLALTANIMSNDLEIYKSNGMIDYLGKPFTSQELWKCLMKYLTVTEFISTDKKVQDSDDAKSLKQLQLYFLRNNKNTFSDIKQALEHDDSTLAYRLAHSLKGNAGQIGEKRLQEAAAVTEGMLSKGRDSVSDEQMQRLNRELNIVLENLNRLLTEPEVKKDKAVDNRKAMEILKILEPMLENRRTECMNMLEELRAIPGSDELVMYVEDFEFTQALNALSALKRNLVTKKKK